MFVPCNQSKLTRADWFFLGYLPGGDITQLSVSDSIKRNPGTSSAISSLQAYGFFDAILALSHPALSHPCCLGLPFVLLSDMRSFLFTRSRISTSATNLGIPVHHFFDMSHFDPATSIRFSDLGFNLFSHCPDSSLQLSNSSLSSWLDLASFFASRFVYPSSRPTSTNRARGGAKHFSGLPADIPFKSVTRHDCLVPRVS